LIHKYAFTYLIRPLIDKGKLQLKYLKWVPPDKKEDAKEEGDDDDVDIDNSDSQFKLIALLLQDNLTSKKPNLQDFLKSNNLEQAIDKRKDKLEDADNVKEFIEEDILEEHRNAILRALKLSDSE
jgi:hypothetical protein